MEMGRGKPREQEGQSSLNSERASENREAEKGWEDRILVRKERKKERKKGGRGRVETNENQKDEEKEEEKRRKKKMRGREDSK